MMKINKQVLFLFFIAFLITGGIFVNPFKGRAGNQPQTIPSKTGDLSSIMTVSGDVEAETQANLSFLTPGRVAYLGVKAGDQVQKGEVLASLDTTIASHNLTAAQAGYRSAKAALDKVIDDIHLFQYGNGGFANVGSSNETQTQKTQRQEAQETVNVAYDNMQSAAQQLALQSIVAPFDGTVLSVQNIESGINVSPTSGSSITIAGGGDLKFVADVSQQDINQIFPGQTATITLDGVKKRKFSGTVTKIADSKTVLPDGRVVFKVDIQAADLAESAQAGQGGTIEISTKQAGLVVPPWTVLANKYVWVTSGKKPQLKEVTVGQTMEGKTSITSGLGPADQVILDPQIIAKSKYKVF